LATRNSIQIKLIIALLLPWLSSLSGIAYAYDYPIEDPYIATVVGTPPALRAKLPESIPVKIRNLENIIDRDAPKALWYYESLPYSYAAQKNEAPLIFIVAGTGGFHNGSTNMTLMRAFYQAGFHVVGITSPTHPNFVVAASTTGVPGYLEDDAKDLYHVMEMIWSDLQNKIKVSKFHLTGYSLGGSQSAYVAKLDTKQKSFNFGKVLLINPSLTLYNSVSKLDRMLENIPGGMDHFNEFFAMIVQKVTKAYKQSDSITFNEELIYKAFQNDLPSDEQLAAIIGAAFRLFSANMIFTSDVITNYGFVKPKNVTLTKNTALSGYLRVNMRLGFTDYYHEYFFPYFRAKEPSLTRSTLAERLSLRNIENFLYNAKNIGVVHNQDDIILAKGEIDFFPDTFGNRAKIYPRGGHMGNLAHHETLAYIVNFFK